MPTPGFPAPVAEVWTREWDPAEVQAWAEREWWDPKLGGVLSLRNLGLARSLPAIEEPCGAISSSVWAMTVSNGDPRPKEELDRELGELLDEVRVGLPGVSVLFAFLLTLPFAARFERLSGAQQVAYYVAFFSAAIAMVCLVTPSAFHRVRWRRGDKEAILRSSNRLALAGFAFLAVALVASVLLVSELVLPKPLPFVATAVIGVLVMALWFGLPVSRRLRAKGDAESRE